MHRLQTLTNLDEGKSKLADKKFFQGLVSNKMRVESDTKVSKTPGELGQDTNSYAKLVHSYKRNDQHQETFRFFVYEETIDTKKYSAILVQEGSSCRVIITKNNKVKADRTLRYQIESLIMLTGGVFAAKVKGANIVRSVKIMFKQAD